MTYIYFCVIYNTEDEFYNAIELASNKDRLLLAVLVTGLDEYENEIGDKKFSLIYKIKVDDISDMKAYVHTNGKPICIDINDDSVYSITPIDAFRKAKKKAAIAELLNKKVKDTKHDHFI